MKLYNEIVTKEDAILFLYNANGMKNYESNFKENPVIHISKMKGYWTINNFVRKSSVRMRTRLIVDMFIKELKDYFRYFEIEEHDFSKS